MESGEICPLREHLLLFINGLAAVMAFLASNYFSKESSSCIQATFSQFADIYDITCVSE